MSAIRTGGLGGVIIIALFSASAAGAAAPKPITGTLSEPGYEVFALAASGEATSALAEPEFRLRPPAKRVGLHLRAADGTYGGPVVVAKQGKGKRAIVGVRAGAKLGDVEVKAAKGYARLAEKPAARSLDTKNEARARKGVPIGAGVFGRVRSQDADGPAADRDLDGLPAPLDVDDDGDLVLDNLEGPASGGGARTAQADGCVLPGGVPCPIIAASLASSDLGGTVNVNAGSTQEQIDAALSINGVLRFSPPGEPAELDCGDPDTGLGYCRQNNSTGKVFNVGEPRPPFPACCDSGLPGDPDGFGTTPSFLAHGARARDPDLDPAISQIGAGDPVALHIATGGDGSPCPPPNPPSPSCASSWTTVNYVFATTPALVSYNDGAGNEASVTYPVPPPSPGTTGAPGQMGNGFPVSDSADDTDTDIEVRLTFWRPQRKPIAGEKCPEPDGPLCGPDEWIDIGGLTYGSSGCPQGAFSNPDPQWTDSPHALAPGFTDPAPDQPANSNNKFSYELNLTQCIAANGFSFEQGQEQPVAFTARAGAAAADFTQHTVVFKRQ